MRRTPTSDEGGIGAALSIIMLALLLVVGGFLYFTSEHQEDEKRRAITADVQAVLPEAGIAAVDLGIVSFIPQIPYPQATIRIELPDGRVCTTQVAEANSIWTLPPNWEQTCS